MIVEVWYSYMHTFYTKKYVTAKNRYLQNFNAQENLKLKKVNNTRTYVC